MARRIRDFDWSATPLGATETWPERRKGVVDAVLANGMPLCLLWGPELLWIYNDAFLPLLGPKHPAGFGRPLRDSLPEMWSSIGPLLARAYAGETVRVEDAALSIARGAAPEAAWFTFSLAPLSDAGGVAAILASAVESTERVLNLAALRASAARQAFLVRLNDVLRPLSDPVEIKGEACRMLGEHLRTDRTYYVEVDQGRQLYIVERDYVRGDAPSLVGQHPVELYPIVTDALRRGRTFFTEDLESDSRIGEGERRSCIAYAIRSYVSVPIVKRGELLALMCVANVERRCWAAEEVAHLEDVAERTWDAVQRARIEAALRESESRLRIVTELAPALLSETDPNGNRISVNRGWREYSGQTLEESWGWGWLAAIHPEDREASERTFREAFAAERPLQREHRIRRRDGVYRWFLVRQQPMHDEQGKLVRWLGVATDVHEQRAALEVARAAREEAELANRLKDDFLATLSHELRTPMAAILLWVGALRSGALPAAELSRGIDAIALSAESLSRLIEDLLDLSRLASGKLVLCHAPVDVAKVTAAAVELVRPTAAAKGIELTSEVSPEIGIALLDGMRLQQILCNLLANATKFTPEGGAVMLCVRRREGRLELEVTDTGMGIPADFMPHLFEKFSQADMGNTRQHAGLGIGLALAKQLVELHGGTILAESAGPGQGSRFRVQLPWILPPAEAAGKSSPRPNGFVGSSALAGVRVLIVEDDANTRAGMQATLASAGAEVITANNAAAALAALAEPGADIIVSDIGLPGVSGLELIAHIAREYRRSGRTPPPSCAVSAYAHEAERQRGINAGFDLYLTKPIAPARLLEAVSDLRDIATASRRQARG